ncbi:hypothetical protein A2U01_0074622, partial [Trifolium medium]|nr:hypothetical protein [Trifolium medium]
MVACVLTRMVLLREEVSHAAE